MSFGGMAMPESGGGAAAGESGGAWQEAAAGPGSGDGLPNVDAAFKLQVEEGASVSATFPFFGDPAGGQLSFQIGDHIKVGETGSHRLFCESLGLFQKEEFPVPRHMAEFCANTDRVGP